MKKFLILFISAFWINLISAQESKLPVFITDSLEKYITRWMYRWEIPGLAVGIVKDGRIVFMKGYGVKKAASTETVDENTLFMIGSITKTFTATALAILQDEKKLNLEDKVQKWVPEFKLKDQFMSGEVTISDLLSGRIGLESNQGDFVAFFSDLSRTEVIQTMGLMVAPYAFRTRFRLINPAFLTAGEIIPGASGKSWEETVKEKILIPLKMDHTTVLTAEFEKSNNKAFPHSVVDNRLAEIPIMSLDNVAPAASISSSVRDMTNWLLAQLDGGKSDGQQVISARALQAIRNPYCIVGTNPNKGFVRVALYGLGLFIWDANGKLEYWHNGNVPGFNSSFMIVPEDNLGIVILTNSDFNNFYDDLRGEILNAFFDIPYQGLTERSYKSLTQYRNFQKANIDSLRRAVKLNNKTTLPLKEFCGTYYHDVYGEISIIPEGEVLIVHFSHHPDLSCRLEHIKNNSFLCTWSNPVYGIFEVPFKVEKEQVIEFTLRSNAEFSPYIFRKKGQETPLLP